MPFVKARWSLSQSPPLLASLSPPSFQTSSVSFLIIPPVVQTLLCFSARSSPKPPSHSLVYCTFIAASRPLYFLSFLPFFLPPPTADSSLHAAFSAHRRSFGSARHKKGGNGTKQKLACAKNANTLERRREGSCGGYGVGGGVCLVSLEMMGHRVTTRLMTETGKKTQETDKV